MTTTIETTLSAAVQVLTDLEAEDQRLSAEATALKTRLSEIDKSYFSRQDALAAAHQEVVAAAKRSQG